MKSNICKLLNQAPCFLSVALANSSRLDRGDHSRNFLNFVVEIYINKYEKTDNVLQMTWFFICELLKVINGLMQRTNFFVVPVVTLKWF